MMTSKEIVDRIDELLKSKNDKRQSLYDYAEIASNSFSNWTSRENSKIPAQVLYKIAQYLNVSVEYLITGKENETPKGVLDLAADINSLSPAFQNAVRIIVDQLKALSMR